MYRSLRPFLSAKSCAVSAADSCKLRLEPRHFVEEHLIAVLAFDRCVDLTRVGHVDVGQVHLGSDLFLVTRVRLDDSGSTESDSLRTVLADIDGLTWLNLTTELPA